ncbi:hypothetical protein D4764_10G0002170 [Takifugu flavidus]|uniref:Uncharacterized protein n=1 Tax=Takifugu flavidus TaxID=433684 RepID=A0A5C6PL91_9TELE|nr:hypothetical protein D4764_10G0002170 [Takifugu flavidus]
MWPEMWECDLTAILTPRPSACSRACALASGVSTQRFRLVIRRPAYSSPRTHHLYHRLWLSQLIIRNGLALAQWGNVNDEPCLLIWALFSPVLHKEAEMGVTPCMLR